MLSVITFMAITFLAVSRRSKGQVTTSTEQLIARLATDSARERAVAQILSSILATTNVNSFDLLVSTNFVNPVGFDAAGTFDSRTNVNFDYTLSGVPLTTAETLQNLTNLLYDARVPVFVTNRYYGSNEFRFSVDLNRDGVHTPSGWLIVTNENGGFYTVAGVTIPASNPPPSDVLRNYFTGDPEFIGILRRGDRPHSADNEFVSRYAFIVVPAGKTLDVNYIHNHAKSLPPCGPWLLSKSRRWELGDQPRCVPCGSEYERLGASTLFLRNQPRVPKLGVGFSRCGFVHEIQVRLRFRSIVLGAKTLRRTWRRRLPF